MSELNSILQRNAEWARAKVGSDPDYFTRLSAGQSPDLLWIGCSDSRVPASAITGLEPGQVFVHRNIANLAHPADLNCMSVLQYAVEALKVRHIVVCGHYGCGGVKAALKGAPQGPIDYWREPIRQLVREKRDHLATLADDEKRVDYLCEENVRVQLRNIARSPVMRGARERGQAVSLHGWIFSLSDGHLRDLKYDTADVLD